MAHLTFRSGIEGWITVYALNPRTGVARDRRTFRNLVVNGGLDALGGANISNTLVKFAVGTGTTQPAPTQTALVTGVNVGGQQYHSTAHTGDGAEGGGGADPHQYGYFRRVLRTGDSVADLNLEEIGWFNSANVMFNRQRFKDSGGADATFTLLTGEQLVAELEVRFYAPTGDATSTLVLNSGMTSASTHTVTTRPVAIGHSSGWNSASGLVEDGWGAAGRSGVSTQTSLNPRTTYAAVGTAAASVNVDAYSNGNYYRDATFTWDPSTFTADIGSVFWLSGRFQSTVTPVLSKTTLNRLKLTIRHSWSTVTT